MPSANAEQTNQSLQWAKDIGTFRKKYCWNLSQKQNDLLIAGAQQAAELMLDRASSMEERKLFVEALGFLEAQHSILKDRRSQGQHENRWHQALVETEAVRHLLSAKAQLLGFTGTRPEKRQEAANGHLLEGATLLRAFWGEKLIPFGFYFAFFKQKDILNHSPQGFGS